MSPATLFRGPTGRAAAVLGLLLFAGACTDERSGYDPGSRDVHIDPADAARLDLQGVDLPPLPDIPLLDDAADTAMPNDQAGDVEVPPPDATGDADTGGPPPVDITDPPPDPRTCDVVVRYEGNADSVHIAGIFNGWDPVANPLTRDGSTWSVDMSDLATGSHPYKLVVQPPPSGDNPWILDPDNPRRVWVDGVENSKLEVPDCERPLIELVSLDTDTATGRIDVVVQIVDGASAPGISADSVTVRLNGAPLTGATYHAPSHRLLFSVAGAAVPGKYSFLVDAANANGPAETLYLPVWLEEEPFHWEDAVLYFLFVDRFANGDPSNDGGADCPGGIVWDLADWMGGDWKGALDKLEEGWFEDLGVTALWITAPQNNPSICGQGTFASRLYSSYHGYHPESQRDVEEHFGTADDFRALVEAAHARGIRVLVDAVINHVHANHPWDDQHEDWFNYPESGNIADLICGTGCGGNCWDAEPIRCWFMDYLPDIDYQVDDAVEAVTDDLVWWVEEFGLDGFRVDAVKHVEDALVYELRAELGDHAETTGDVFYTVGETFVGGDDAGIALLERYINPWMLHGQFDFPLFWDIRGAFTADGMSLSQLATRLEQVQTVYGPNALMSNFLGNHDVTRFLSDARGDADDAQNPPPAPAAGDPGLDALYGRLELAFGFLMTIPGIPLIYYGDEVGLVGAGDPDNRRMMVFDNFPVPQQERLLQLVQRLGQARRDSVALRRGELRVLEPREDDHLAYTRRMGTGEAALVALNRHATTAWTASLDVSALGWSDGQVLHDAASGAPHTLQVSGGRATITVPPRSEGGLVVLVAE